MNEQIRTWTLRFPAKKSIIWRRHCSIDQSCCSMKSKRSIDWFLESSSGMKFFHPSVRFTNQKPRTFVSVQKTSQIALFPFVCCFCLFARFHFKVIRKSLQLSKTSKKGSWASKMRELLAQRTSWNSSFYKPWFCHIFFTILMTKHQTQTQLFFSFFVIKIDYRFFSALRCTDFCQRFQKNVMRYAATLRDWHPLH